MNAEAISHAIEFSGGASLRPSRWNGIQALGLFAKVWRCSVSGEVSLYLWSRGNGGEATGHGVIELREGGAVYRPYADACPVSQVPFSAKSDEFAALCRIVPGLTHDAPALRWSLPQAAQARKEGLPLLQVHHGRLCRV